MLEFAETWREGQRAKGKTPYELLYNENSGWLKGTRLGLGLGVLKKVTAADKVYIVCHGNPNGSRNIGANRGATRQSSAGIDQWEGGTLKQYDAAGLANLLNREGLPLQFIDLRVFACGSGVVPDGSAESFAQGLAQAMRALGYRSIRVTGYLGAVRSSYAIRQVPNQLGEYTDDRHKGVEINGEILPAHTHKVVF
ncbi:MAG TPA: hypothetical protein VFP68_24475 [Burkholderiaceae bacterium]|nr:hypothetical protein [Burkholderiaceae bacterium]